VVSRSSCQAPATQPLKDLLQQHGASPPWLRASSPCYTAYEQLVSVARALEC